MSKTALKQHEDDRNKLLQQEAEITREVQQLTERRTALSQSLEAGRTEFESLKTSQEVNQLEVRMGRASHTVANRTIRRSWRLLLRQPARRFSS